MRMHFFQKFNDYTGINTFISKRIFSRCYDFCCSKIVVKITHPRNPQDPVGTILPRKIHFKLLDKKVYTVRNNLVPFDSERFLTTITLTYFPFFYSRRSFRNVYETYFIFTRARARRLEIHQTRKEKRMRKRACLFLIIRVL